MNLAPIILFVYNRPWHTQLTVEALQKCELATESDLHIFADGPKEDASDEAQQKIADVRKYIHTIDGFKSIHITESPINKGLANSVIQGVSEVINKYGKVIVVEDDIVAHPFFLRFMNEALDFYADDHRIYSIGGYNYNFQIPQSYKKDVYIVHRAESWGWATWKDRWDNIDWKIGDAPSFFQSENKIKRFNRGGSDMSNMLKAQLNGEIDSWAIRWDYHMYKHNAYCLRPVKTLVNNIGFDGTGIHSGDMDTSTYSAPQYDNTIYKINMVKSIKPNKTICRAFKHFFDGIPCVSPVKKIKRFVKRYFLFFIYH